MDVGSDHFPASTEPRRPLATLPTATPMPRCGTWIAAVSAGDSFVTQCGLLEVRVRHGHHRLTSEGGGMSVVETDPRGRPTGPGPRSALGGVCLEQQQPPNRRAGPAHNPGPHSERTPELRLPRFWLGYCRITPFQASNESETTLRTGVLLAVGGGGRVPIRFRLPDRSRAGRWAGVVKGGCRSPDWRAAGSVPGRRRGGQR